MESHDVYKNLSSVKKTNTSLNPANNKEEKASYSPKPEEIQVSDTKKDEFVNKNKKETLLGRLYGFLYKKKQEDGEIKDFDKFEKNKKNFSSTIITTLTTLGALGAGNFFKKIAALSSSFTKTGSKQLKMASIGATTLSALAIRPILNTINNIGADKEVKKENKTGIKNTLAATTGAVLTSISPALAPVALTINALESYFSNKNNDKTGIKDFLDNHKETLFIDIIALGAILGAGIKGKNKIDEVTGAIDKVKTNIAHPIMYRMKKDQLTEFQSLARDLGFDLSVLINKNGTVNLKKIKTLDEDLLNILLEKGQDGNIEGKMKKIEEMNIFLPKYFQTVVDIPDEVQKKISKEIDLILDGRKMRQNAKSTLGEEGGFFTNMAIDEALDEMEKRNWSLSGLKDYAKIIEKIKSDCPVSRTVDEAQEMIDSAFSKGKYTIDKTAKNQGLLGVGSIAESYIAHDEKGNEVVIKLVKKHLIQGDKIQQDQMLLLNKLKEKSDISEGIKIHFGPSKYTIESKERLQYDENQVKNMCKVWGGETDLSQEAISASQIREQANKYQAIKTIESKKNIFVMEKAKGTQLDNPDIARKWQEAGLDEQDFSNFVDSYIGAYCEQLFSLPKAGQKVVQSDPHGGNILVDLESIKSLRKKDGKSPITIIDYGNTTKTSPKDAANNLFNHIDYLFGDTDSIAAHILNGADLNGADKKHIIKQLSKGLREDIFNADTKIDVQNPIEIFRATNAYCLDFMQKNNIIPNASNINQMKAEETYILSNLGCLKRIADGCGYDLGKVIDKKRIIKQLMGEMTKSTAMSFRKNPIFTIKQLSSRVKYILNEPENAFSCLGANFEVL